MELNKKLGPEEVSTHTALFWSIAFHLGFCLLRVFHLKLILVHPRPHFLQQDSCKYFCWTRQAVELEDHLKEVSQLER